VPYLSALEVCSRRGAIQKFTVTFTFTVVYRLMAATALECCSESITWHQLQTIQTFLSVSELIMAYRDCWGSVSVVWGLLSDAWWVNWSWRIVTVEGQLAWSEGCCQMLDEWTAHGVSWLLRVS